MEFNADVWCTLKYQAFIWSMYTLILFQPRYMCVCARMHRHITHNTHTNKLTFRYIWHILHYIYYIFMFKMTWTHKICIVYKQYVRVWIICWQLIKHTYLWNKQQVLYVTYISSHLHNIQHTFRIVCVYIFFWPDTVAYIMMKLDIVNVSRLVNKFRRFGLRATESVHELVEMTLYKSWHTYTGDCDRCSRVTTNKPSTFWTVGHFVVCLAI